MLSWLWTAGAVPGTATEAAGMGAGAAAVAATEAAAAAAALVLLRVGGQDSVQVPIDWEGMDTAPQELSWPCAARPGVATPEADGVEPGVGVAIPCCSAHGAAPWALP